MSAPPRLCIVVPSLAPGGTERQILYLAEGLSPDFSIDIICAREKGAWGERAEPFAHLNVLGVSSGWDFRFSRKLFKYFRERTPDILQTYLSGFDHAANAAARRAMVPVVVSSRRERATWKRRRHLWLQRRANRYVDAIVANSRAVAEYSAHQEGEPVERFKVIYNGVASAMKATKDLRVELTLPRSVPVVGMVANFSVDKDHGLFVDTAKTIHARRPDVHFVLVGEGPSRETIQRSVVNRGLGDVFRFVGGRRDAADLYSVFDVAMLTSKTEGMPNVVLEAMAAGRPVVAAEVGGVPEVIENGVNGVLIESRIARDFADAVMRLLERPDAAAEMGRRAADHVRSRFSIDAMVAQHRELYLNLLHAKRPETRR